MNIKAKIQKRKKREKRVRNKIKGTSEMPRITVFRSNNHIYAQLIDDVDAITLVSANDLKSKGKSTKSESAKAIGLELAQKAKAKKITKAVLDRGGYRYHGRVKEIAEGMREGGIQL